mgnify:CR=1 FL=1
MADYLLFSDSHGDNQRMYEVIDRYRDRIQGIIHMGDLEGKEQELFRYFPGMVCMVRGNCDRNQELPMERIFTLEGHKILVTHGHTYRVNAGLLTLKMKALSEGAEVCLFGHTHVACKAQEDGILFANPGSIRLPRGEERRPSYGILTLQEGEAPKVEIYWWEEGKSKCRTAEKEKE